MKEKKQNNKGFTLIEVLVVLMIILVVGLLIVGVFFASVRNANKAKSLDVVKNNGNYAIEQIGRNIRYAGVFDGVSETGVDGTFQKNCILPVASNPSPSQSVASAQAPPGFFASLIDKIPNFSQIKQNVSLFTVKLLSEIFPSSSSKTSKLAVVNTRQEVLAAGVTVSNWGSILGNNVSAPMSMGHVINSGTDRLVIVSIVYHYAGAPDPTITFAGQAMIPIGTDGTNPTVKMFYLINPPIGNQNISVNLNETGHYVILSAISFDGVDQNAPLGVMNSEIGLSASPSVVVNSTAGDVVLGVAGVLYPPGDPIVGPNQTQRWNQRTQTQVTAGVGSTEPGASSVTMSWDTTSIETRWTIMAIPIKPVLNPNLVVDSVTTDKSIYMPGEAMIITSIIRNSGEDNITTPFFNAKNTDSPEVEPACNTVSWTGYDILSLNAGVSDIRNINTTAPMIPAPYRAGIYADTNPCQISEGSETDNYGRSATYNVVTPTSTPTPLPTPVPVTCSPSSQSVYVGERADLWASGGDGSYSWSSLDGNPSSGIGSFFAPKYATVSSNQAIVTSGVSNDTCIVDVISSPIATQYKYVQVTDSSGEQLTYSCISILDNPAEEGIKLTDSLGVETELVDILSVQVDSCSITCRQDNIASPPTVTVKFELSSRTDSAFPENKATIPFQTSVTTRNF